MIEFRKICMDDCAKTYEWRNAPSTRRYFRSSKPLTFDEHCRWTNSVIDDENRILLMAEDDGIPVGVVRFDSEGESAEISIYLDPEQVGQGYGKQIIAAASEWARNNIRKIKRLEAEIFDDNIASVKSFKSTGFRKLDNGTIYILDLIQ